MLSTSHILTFGEFRFDPSKRELSRSTDTRSSTPVPLGSRAAELLLLFLRRPGDLVTKNEIMDAVWPNTAVEESNLPVQISAVRRALDDSSGTSSIQTVPGRGYRFTRRVAGADETADVAGPAVAGSERSCESGAPISLAPSISAPVTPQPRRRPLALWIGSAVLVGAATLAVALWFPGLARRDAQLPAAQKFDASVVPLITDEARNELATYPSRPDFKAVAISADTYGIAMAARDASTASAEALERCKMRSRPNASCRLYAVGTDVVWSTKSLALPLPFDIHAEPLEDAFNVAELPLNIPGSADIITKNYVNKKDHRVLALRVTPQVIGRYLAFSGATLLSSAVRRATEQCADFYQLPCLIVSVDGFWTVRVPKTRRILGLFLLTTEAEMSDQDRQRIGPTYQQKDWRALARGKSGGWYAVGGAPSESAAVEQALHRCAERDSECHLHAISNFLVADDK
jgi:DNA-binding winged helix-turn-helix (wHTH) protein